MVRELYRSAGRESGDQILGKSGVLHRLLDEIHGRRMRFTAASTVSPQFLNTH